MRYLATALLVIGLLSFAHPVEAQKRLVILGSSTSACLNLVGLDSCYVNKLRDHFDSQAPFGDTTVDAIAVPGYNVYRGMPSSYTPPHPESFYQPDPNNNITKVLSLNPTIVIVNYPTNNFDIASGLTVAEIMFCFRTIRDSSNAKGVPCFITTTQPRTSPVSYSTPQTKARFAELKDSILLEFGPFAINFWDGMFNAADTTILTGFNSGDDIHFNGAGHNILYQRVLAKNIFSATLPATFLKYNVSYRNQQNQLTWTTAKEIDVASYEIQRSGDGVNFTRMGSVSAVNSSGTNQYQFADQQPLKGWNYYKILIVDRDEKKQSSPVLKVFADASKLAIKKIMTLPAQVILQLQNDAAQTAELQITSSTGALLRKEAVHIEAGNDVSLSINTSVLSRGVYYIRLVTITQQPVVGSFVK